MAWFGGGKKKETEKKVLRVGMLGTVHDLDPRRTQELGTVMVLTQMFEAPYELAAADEPTKPVLFAEPLRSENGGVTASAPVKQGILFSDGTPLTAALGPTVVVCAWRVKNFEPSPLGLPSLAAVDVETLQGR